MYCRSVHCFLEPRRRCQIYWLLHHNLAPANGSCGAEMAARLSYYIIYHIICFTSPGPQTSQMSPWHAEVVIRYLWPTWCLWYAVKPVKQKWNISNIYIFIFTNALLSSGLYWPVVAWINIFLFVFVALFIFLSFSWGRLFGSMFIQSIKPKLSSSFSCIFYFLRPPWI